VARISVRQVTPDDAEALAALLQEVDGYYGAEPASVAQKVADFHDTLFGDAPAAAGLLAWDGDKPVGLAAYAFLWPAAGVSTSLYLKELYVTEAYRGSGAGRLLMQRLCAVAADKGCSRVEWTTDRDNADAQRFYEHLGASALTSKIFYRLDEADMRKLAESAS
jgi:GNAT superfamily N-acetyltransferase